MCITGLDIYYICINYMCNTPKATTYYMCHTCGTFGSVWVRVSTNVKCEGRGLRTQLTMVEWNVKCCQGMLAQIIGSSIGSSCLPPIYGYVELPLYAVSHTNMVFLSSPLCMVMWNCPYMLLVIQIRYSYLPPIYGYVELPLYAVSHTNGIFVFPPYMVMWNCPYMLLVMQIWYFCLPPIYGYVELPLYAVSHTNTVFFIQIHCHRQ